MINNSEGRKMREFQDRIREFIGTYQLEDTAEMRFLSLVSEIGALSKEIMMATDYGYEDIDATDEIIEELGDVIFATLNLCNILGVDAASALNAALSRYEKKFQGR